MRRRVTDDLESFRITIGDDCDVCIGLDAIRRIDHFAVDLARERGLGESRTNAQGDLGDRDRARKRSLRAVR